MKGSVRLFAIAFAIASLLPGWAPGRPACAMGDCTMGGSGNERGNCPSAATKIAASCCRPSPAPWATQTKLSVLPDTAAPATAVVPAALAHRFDATALRVAAAGPVCTFAPLARNCILRI